MTLKISGDRARHPLRADGMVVLQQVGAKTRDQCRPAALRVDQGGLVGLAVPVCRADQASTRIRGDIHHSSSHSTASSRSKPRPRW